MDDWHSGTVKFKTATARFFMKNSRALLLFFASILLRTPPAAKRAQAVSTMLTPGTASLIGTVDVSNLQATGQSTINTKQAPLHSQGLQAYDQAKAQAGQTGYVPADEAAKTVATVPSTPSPLTTTGVSFSRERRVEHRIPV